MTSYGRGMTGLGQIDCAGKLTRGLEAVIRDCYHALITERRSLPANPERGLGLLSLTFADTDTPNLPAIASDIESEYGHDDRIKSTEALVTLDATGVLVIDVAVYLAAGPSFRLVGPIGSVRAELINGN